MNPLALSSMQPPAGPQAPALPSSAPAAPQAPQFGGGRDEVRFSGRLSDASAKLGKLKDGKGLESAKGLLGKAGSFVKNYFVPLTATSVGVATLVGSQALHLVPVLGSIPAVGLSVAGAGLAGYGVFAGIKKAKANKAAG